MKVTFILPCVGRKGPRAGYVRTWIMEPVAIAVLSSLTPPDIERVFYDDRLEAIPCNEPTDLVAINVETYSARRAYQIGAHYRARGVPVVMGGFHATLVPNEVARFADVVIVGEAEELWPRLLKDFAKGKLQPRYETTMRPSLAGLMPDRAIYKDKRYLKLSLVETARGCPHGCEFCSISSFFKRSYNPRPVEDVVTEIRILKHRNVFFIDDNLHVDPERTRELLEALTPLGIRWIGQVSLSVADDEALLPLFKRSGCLGFLIGFESLDADALAAMGKGVNRGAADYDDSLARIRAHGLAIYGTFMFGYDGDDERAFAATLDFAIRHRFFFAAFNHVVPFPGTPLYRRLEQEGRLLHKAWWLSDSYRFGDMAFHPKRLTAERTAQLCYEYRKRFYRFPSILRRSLHVRGNCPSPAVALAFFVHNLGSGRDVRRRQSLPLGLPWEPDPSPS